MHHHHHPITFDTEGHGYIPLEEEPQRVSTSTPEDKEQEYDINILNMPHIIEALKENEAITDFCNLPEAVLRLNLDPEVIKNAKLLNTGQYGLNQRLIDAATPVIDRWLATGKITL